MGRIDRRLGEVANLQLHTFLWLCLSPSWNELLNENFKRRFSVIIILRWFKLRTMFPSPHKLTWSIQSHEADKWSRWWAHLKCKWAFYRERQKHIVCFVKQEPHIREKLFSLSLYQATWHGTRVSRAQERVPTPPFDRRRRRQPRVAVLQAK